MKPGTPIVVAFLLTASIAVLAATPKTRGTARPDSAGARRQLPNTNVAEDADTLEVAQDEYIPRGRVTLPGIWSPSGAHVYSVADNQDDGTELDTWYPDGYAEGLNYVGIDSEGERFVTVLRFHLTDLEHGTEIAYARLRIAPRGGEIRQSLDLAIHGAYAGGAPVFSDEHLPSKLPRTRGSVAWRIKHLQSSSPELPVYCNTPNIAWIIEDIASRPDWDSCGRTLTLMVGPDSTTARTGSYIRLDDTGASGDDRHPPILEIYPTVKDAFLARPMLGRPTDKSVTVTATNLMAIDIGVFYGLTPGGFMEGQLPLHKPPPGRPAEIVIGGLEPNTTYHYRLRYRASGFEDFYDSEEFTFRTQAAPGTGFTFTIQADTHILSALTHGDTRRLRLYDRTLQNVLADHPDFHIDMGDFAHIEYYAGLSARSYNDALDRYLFQRKCLERVSNTIPFYLVLGNHEGEQGWRTGLEQDSLEVWGTLARKAAIPNPYPDGFYSGNQDTSGCCGLKEDYYAWQWGDALFVVLDPFSYTTTRPHSTGGLYKPSLNGWDWTLGKAQYDWLYDTLHESDATWKFVFSHHMTGGILGGRRRVSPYGRGGMDAAKFSVCGRPSFEWGGEDSTGAYVFDTMRPGWSHGPIHDMLVEEGVDIFFRGHDHAFVYEELDGVVYQTCPQPANDAYSDGEYRPAFFTTGTVRNSSGHIRVSVTPDSVRVDYVRSVLPEDEPLHEDDATVTNGTVSYSYVLKR
jgi:hypothetical protein